MLLQVYGPECIVFSVTLSVLLLLPPQSAASFQRLVGSPVVRQEYLEAESNLGVCNTTGFNRQNDPSATRLAFHERGV